MIIPNRSSQLLQKAFQLIQQKEFIPAINMLRPLSKQEPKNFEIWNLLGIAAKNVGDIKLAEKSFNKCIKVNPKAIGAYNNLANLYVQIKQYKKSIISYKKALSIKPSFIDARYNLGITT